MFSEDHWLDVYIGACKAANRGCSWGSTISQPAPLECGISPWCVAVIDVMIGIYLYASLSLRFDTRTAPLEWMSCVWQASIILVINCITRWQLLKCDVCSVISRLSLPWNTNIWCLPVDSKSSKMFDHEQWFQYLSEIIIIRLPLLDYHYTLSLTYSLMIKVIWANTVLLMGISGILLTFFIQCQELETWLHYSFPFTASCFQVCLIIAVCLLAKFN